jgi:hypothetical protein
MEPSDVAIKDAEIINIQTKKKQRRRTGHDKNVDSTRYQSKIVVDTRFAKNLKN